MAVAIIIGRKNSKGFPGKNTYPVLGRPLAYYPMKAALDCPEIGRLYISTDDPKLIALGMENGIEIIRRPKKLCSDKALGEEVFLHAYNYIKKRIKDQKIEILVLLMCNAPSITSKTISKGIKILKENPSYDAAVTVSSYNMWSPFRARKIKDDKLLHPFVPPERVGDLKNLNCDRDCQGDVWFADMGVSVVRAKCLQNMDKGLLPQRWMGRHIYPLKQWGGCDVDFEWQLPMVEYWLKKHGFKDARI